MDEQAIADFQTTVLAYYVEHGRHDLPWRQSGADGTFDPYRILVSEVMLQQTQVVRVTPKFVAFLERFPDVRQLAAAPLGDVLVAWQGLGYNRRAKFLWQAAQKVRDDFVGQFPRDQEGLVGLPGVGRNTAGAVLAYAYDRPAVFVETNIRSVFIHHFFRDASDVHDKAVLELVAASLPAADVREWYWALMDYGVHIKQTVGNTARASRSYARQSPFHGSRRQVRGAVIRELGGRPAKLAELHAAIADPRLADVLADLEREGMISRDGDGYALA